MICKILRVLIDIDLSDGLQIATADEAFLIDILSLREKEKLAAHQGEAFVQQVFANPNVLKLGFSMKEDLNVLSRSLPGFENITKSMRKWIDLHSLWGNIQNCNPPFFPKSGNFIAAK